MATAARRIREEREPAPEPLLQLQGLARRFGTRVALEALTLQIYPGEIFGLLGPNGAGKSTTFQLLAGLLLPDAGQVVFEGRTLSLNDPSLRARLGVVFQRNSLDDQLTARENLMLGARLYALPREKARARVEEMLQLIELQDRGDERVAGWSGGMRRRLELARALIHSPRILLMDEPTQGLDQASFQRFWTHLRTLRAREGLTLVLNTHRPEEAEGCDRLAVLDAGRLVACDTPAALAARLGGDLVLLEGSAPEEIQRVLREKLGLASTLVEGILHVQHAAGHSLIPRIVEAFPPGRLASVQLRKPTLADVFLKITGKLLGADRPSEPPAPKRSKKRGSR
jgi:ABC-2 type transport system ATP-binding protein